MVRLDEGHRKDIDNLKNIFIALPNGGQIPLEQIATVSYEDGPMQISREDGKRRIVLGFNVKDRDVKSVVTDIQKRLDDKLSMPEGYYVTYGGQFENLIEATNRLAIAVPIALLLIFVLLYFTFKSVKQSLMIFTAIPLSAIGGVAALWLRDMPFSISAGVGFIALFGVAVLNGIVLIGQFNNLKAEGMGLYERIIEGTKVRLRPVLLTASVASLGFLPMALSTSAGAEVQKPLATVVIGGLITATILTLIVLPILYYYEEKGFSFKKNKKGVVAALLVLCSLGVNAQEKTVLSLNEALELAKAQNMGIQAADLGIRSEERFSKTAFDLPKTEVSTAFGHLNGRDRKDVSLSVSQSFSPFSYGKKKQVLNKNLDAARINKEGMELEVEFAVRQAWENMLYAISKEVLLTEQATLLKGFSKSAELRYTTGETTLMESNVAKAKEQELNVLITQNKSNLENEKERIKTLLNLEGDFMPSEMELLYDKHDALSDYDLNENIRLKMMKNTIEKIDATRKLEKAAFLPDVTLGYTAESESGWDAGAMKNYGKELGLSSYSVGISIPIFFGSQSAKVKGLKYQVEQAKAEQAYLQKQVAEQVKQQLEIINAQEKLIDYYVEQALQNALTIKDHATKSYNNGDISYIEYIQSVETALTIQMNYLDAVLEYNLTHNNLHYLVNQ